MERKKERRMLKFEERVQKQVRKKNNGDKKITAQQRV